VQSLTRVIVEVAINGKKGMTSHQGRVEKQGSINNNNEEKNVSLYVEQGRGGSAGQAARAKLKRLFDLSEEKSYSCKFRLESV